MAHCAKKFRYQDYTVAWVCALPLEMAVAEAMLDEKHTSLPTNPGDDNTYILGSIFSHNIVISCLPSGIYGTTSAAALASQIRSTFQSIRFGLMVGIGGGVPSPEHDIRLGDVVVSKPTRDFGGVVQFDYGKTTAGGQFERTSVLNKPPSVLLTAISRIQAAHMSSVTRIPALLSDAATRNPSVKLNLTYCGEEQDQLFEFDYEHIESQSTCDKCDPKKLTKRTVRENNTPRIHYGLIGSGNQVMKHGHTRNKLAQELGILCFEMEAAGLMDNFPCLVVRGICDYADSHKNKQWQPYAAATAAAYAKELLSVIHPTRVTETPLDMPNNEIILSKSDSQIQMGSFSNWISHKGSVEDEKAIFDRISTYDHEKAHQRLSRKRLVDTTHWFLSHPEFKSWFEKEYTCLWCSGKIGSGKTMIATSVIEAAKYRSPSMKAPTVFFYCEDEQHASLEGSYILSSLIKQLCLIMNQTKRPVPDIVKGMLINFFGNNRIRPDFEDLEDIFIHLSPCVPDTIYVLDGLDSLDRAHSIRLLKTFRSLFYHSTSSQCSRILLLSRDQIPGHIDVSTAMPGIHRISTSPNVLRDIKVYIEASIADKSMERKITDDSGLLEEIKQVLLSESSEMFLWVYLQLEILWETCFTDAEIRSSLSQLPKGLEQTYRRCIERINFSERRALRVLKWVSFAITPLHIEELREAVAFDFEDASWDAAKIPGADFVIGCCANLVVVDSTDNRVRFAHASVRQFLDNEQRNYIPGYPQSTKEGQLECGELCVSYLSFLDFGLELVSPDNQTVAVPIQNPINLAGESIRSPFTRFFAGAWQRKRLSKPLEFRQIRAVLKPEGTRYRFLNYAAANWAIQTKFIHIKSPMWHKFSQLAFKFNESWNFHPWIPGGRSSRSRLHGLFGWAVKEQHIPLLTLATNSNIDIKEVCDIPLVDEGLPALHVAAIVGYNEVVKILLDICKFNLCDANGFTALHHAAHKGHVETVKLLLSKTPRLNIDPRSPKSYKRTPLWLACTKGHVEIAAVLISEGAKLDTQDDLLYLTPLHCAVDDGYFALAKLLIDSGCDINCRDRIGWTPLFRAVNSGRFVFSKLLVDSGCEINCKDDSGESPLFYAVNFVLMKLLIDSGCDVYSKMLGRAMTIGEPMIFKLLWEKVKGFTAEDRRRMLHMAAADNLQEITNILLADATPKDRAFKDDEGLTALHWAARNGSETITSQLLANATPEDISSKDNEGQTPLHWAARNGHERVKGQRPVNFTPENQASSHHPFLFAEAGGNGYEGVTRLLLANATPGDIASKDYRGWTPLHWAVAASNGYEGVTNLLLANATPESIASREINGMYPLHLAVLSRRPRVVSALLDKNADVDCVDNTGVTPLILAVSITDIPIIKLLVQKKANPKHQDNNGRSPLTISRMNGETAVTSILLDELTPSQLQAPPSSQD